HQLTVLNLVQTCNEVQNSHLLAEGMICGSSLLEENPELYKNICKENINFYTFDDTEYQVELTLDQKNLIKEIVLNGNFNIKLNDQNHLLHLAMINLAKDFKEIWEIKSYDLLNGSPSQSTLYRNLDDQNLIRCPDAFYFVKNYPINYEFLYSEFSNGPWSNNSSHKSHVHEDFFRLNQFVKDSYKLIHYFLKNNNLKSGEKIWGIKYPSDLNESAESLIQLCGKPPTTPPQAKRIKLEPDSGNSVFTTMSSP
ncbi:12150_t:CDS:2, partial [Entrophospora sp. SA101]